MLKYILNDLNGQTITNRLKNGDVFIAEGKHHRRVHFVPTDWEGNGYYVKGRLYNKVK